MSTAISSENVSPMQEKRENLVLEEVGLKIVFYKMGEISACFV